MSWRTFLKWMAFSELEPFDRVSYQLAYIVQTLVNLNRDTDKHPDPYPLKDFILRFDQEAEAEKPVQDAAYIERVLMGWIHASNATIARKKRLDEQRRKQREERAKRLEEKRLLEAQKKAEVQERRRRRAEEKRLKA